MVFSPRNKIKVAVAQDNFICPKAKQQKQSDSYGRDVFSQRVMRERLPRGIYKKLEECIENGEPLSNYVADVVANSMKDWALERGATHYTHWFQPMTGLTAEKHDAFYMPTHDGNIINEFSGKMLIKGEPDASSFPTGGIRSTFEARGYTDWDPTSPAFLIENAHGKTLYIPTVFISYTGESLDRKTPLLRSINAVSQQALRVLRLFGNKSASRVDVMVGAEQEYFLVDRRFYKLRLDLQLTGRTVYGAPPSKGQDLEDQYLGCINQRVLAFMTEVEEKLIALGVPVRTRHNETAPAQFELAPVYEDANLATDHNMLTMQVLRSTAEKHNFACLLHEKPFAGVNGSGKHNNWSLRDSDGNNLLDPGTTPHDNAQFLVFMAAVLRAVHKYSAMLAISAASAGNDHRLGGNEAPPNIISIFLGNPLTELLESIISGDPKGDEWDGGTMKIGVSALPPLPKDISDRNRTSPFAFTGNKFEFRTVGSAMSVAPANIAICSAVACSLDDIATELEKAVKDGQEFNDAVQELLARLFEEHMPIVFNGNGYSDEWKEEAARRGLPDHKNAVNTLLEYDKPHVMEGFIRPGVLTERELLARQEILLRSYIKSVTVEGRVASNIGRSMILPAAIKWMNTVADTLQKVKDLSTDGEDPVEESYFKKMRKHIQELMKALDNLDKHLEEVQKIGDTKEHAVAVRDKMVSAIAKCRLHVDALEPLVDDFLWPIPKYNELLWQI